MSHSSRKNNVGGEKGKKKHWKGIPEQLKQTGRKKQNCDKVVLQKTVLSG